MCTFYEQAKLEKKRAEIARRVQARQTQMVSGLHPADSFMCHHGFASMWLGYVYGMSVAARSLVVRSNAALFYLPTYIKTVFACYAAKTPGDAKAVPRSAINDAESLQMERQAFERVLALPISLKHTFFTY